jgi:hypothetical protein
MCPGALAAKIGFKLYEIRSTLAIMQDNGELAAYQRGQPAYVATCKGPFRVAMPAAPKQSEPS